MIESRKKSQDYFILFSLYYNYEETLINSSIMIVEELPRFRNI